MRVERKRASACVGVCRRVLACVGEMEAIRNVQVWRERLPQQARCRQVGRSSAGLGASDGQVLLITRREGCPPQAQESHVPPGTANGVTARPSQQKHRYVCESIAALTLRTLILSFSPASSACEVLIRFEIDPSATGFPPPISSASAADRPAEKRYTSVT